MPFGEYDIEPDGNILQVSHPDYHGGVPRAAEATSTTERLPLALGAC